METQQQKSSTPWGAHNRIPNIKDFVDRLDKAKTKRDQDLDENHVSQETEYSSEIHPHKNEAPKKKGKSVTDPVTGHQVIIADVGKEYMARADNPQVSWSGAYMRTHTHPHSLVIRTEPESRQAHDGWHRCLTKGGGLQAQAGHHCSARSHRGRKHFRCADPWREDQYSIPSYSLSQL